MGIVSSDGLLCNACHYLGTSSHCFVFLELCRKPHVTTDPSALPAAKDVSSGLNLPHMCQLISHSTAATTVLWMSPSDDGSFRADGSKGILSGLQLLHICQVMVHSTAVTARVSTTPCDDGSISLHSSEGRLSGFNRPHMR